MSTIIQDGFPGKQMSRFSESAAKGEQASITCSPLVVTGVDKLKVSCWIDWRDRKVFERLNTHKKGLQESKDQTKAPFDFIKSETKYNFNLHRTGTTKFSYRLTSGDITILLSPRPGKSVLHNTQIEIGSLSCQEDFQGVFNEIIAMFNQLGGFVVKEITQEIHLAADLVGVSLQSTQFFKYKNWICRARDKSLYIQNDEISGISIGSGDIMFRAYDKILEMKSKRQTAKQNFFAKKWNVDISDIDVTRCEFQIRRPILKEFDVPCTTVKEITDNLQALWNYTTRNWARFCTAPVDKKNKNHQRSTISYHWELVQDAVFSKIKTIAGRIRQSLQKNIDALVDMYRGVAMSLAASRGLFGDDLPAIINTSQIMIEEALLKLYNQDESDFRRRMQLRFNECYATVL